jgi:hypothetical protein
MVARRMKRRPKLLFALAIGAALSGAALGTSLVASADPPKAGYPPDPPVNLATKHWVFTIDVQSGIVSLGPARSATTSKPEGTPRVMGRWAIEIYAGKELLDRVRFNVPGMGDGPHTDDKRILKRPSMDRITTHFDVRIADNPRTTSAKLVDRATGDETPIDWPPDAPPAQADAGTDAASDGSAATDAGATTDAGDAGAASDAGK